MSYSHTAYPHTVQDVILTYSRPTYSTGCHTHIQPTNIQRRMSYSHTAYQHTAQDGILKYSLPTYSTGWHHRHYFRDYRGPLFPPTTAHQSCPHHSGYSTQLPLITNTPPPYTEAVPNQKLIRSSNVYILSVICYYKAGYVLP